MAMAIEEISNLLLEIVGAFIISHRLNLSGLLKAMAFRALLRTRHMSWGIY